MIWICQIAQSEGMDDLHPLHRGKLLIEWLLALRMSGIVACQAASGCFTYVKSLTRTNKVSYSRHTMLVVDLAWK